MNSSSRVNLCIVGTEKLRYKQPTNRKTSLSEVSEAYDVGLVRPTPADDEVPLQQTGLQSSASQTRTVWEVGVGIIPGWELHLLTFVFLKACE